MKLTLFSVGSTWLLNQSGSQFHEVQVLHPQKKNINETKQEETEQTKRNRAVY